MEVAAEAAALPIAGLDDPRARFAQRLQPRPQLHLEAVVLDGERGGPGRGRHERGVLGERRGVDQHADPASAVDQLGGDRAVALVRERERAAVAPHVGRLLGEPVADGGRRVPERRRERAVDAPVVAGGRELLEQPAHGRRAEEAGAHEAEQEGDGQRGERRDEHELGDLLRPRARAGVLA